MTTTTKRITGILPEATLAQRVASMSTFDLMTAARKLAKLEGIAADTACTAALDELQKRTRGGEAFEAFEAFVAEIYA